MEQSETELLEQYGRLQLERETHLARLQDTEQKMMRVKEKLVFLTERAKWTKESNASTTERE